jgi:hypothetical protein
MPVNLTIDTSDIPANGNTTTPLYREDLVGIYEQIMVHVNNLANALQAFDGVLIGTGTLDASAILQINSTTKTFVPPRMTKERLFTTRPLLPCKAMMVHLG